MKRYVWLFLVLVLVFFGVRYLITTRSQEPMNLSAFPFSDHYAGECDGYQVSILRTDRQGDEAIHFWVQLQPQAGGDFQIKWPKYTTAQSITGHAIVSDSNVKFYRIIYCGYPQATDACHSYTLASGAKTWQASELAGEAGAVPWSQADLDYALAMLQSCLNQIATLEHLIPQVRPVH